MSLTQIELSSEWDQAAARICNPQGLFYKDEAWRLGEVLKHHDIDRALEVANGGLSLLDILGYSHEKDPQDITQQDLESVAEDALRFLRHMYNLPTTTERQKLELEIPMAGFEAKLEKLRDNVSTGCNEAGEFSAVRAAKHRLKMYDRLCEFDEYKERRGFSDRRDPRYKENSFWDILVHKAPVDEPRPGIPQSPIEAIRVLKKVPSIDPSFPD